ncbi:MAG: hypothetical protein IKZ21_01260, partial [Clostridia bacterium]|nr:hypothetical protein [Clostridia bacterium]
MKRVIALLLCLIMLLTLAACGKPKFSLGRFDGQTYTNEMLSLHFTLPQGWHLAEGEEAETLLGLNRTLFTGMSEEELSAVEDSQTFDLGYAFVMSSDSGKDRFDMLYQKNTNKGDAASYLQSAKTQLESYSDLWEIHTIANDNVTIAGHNYVSLEMMLRDNDTVLRYFYLTTEVEG